jgi:hypothetical protein
MIANIIHAVRRASCGISFGVTGRRGPRKSGSRAGSRCVTPVLLIEPDGLEDIQKSRIVSQRIVNRIYFQRGQNIGMIFEGLF